MKKKPAAFALVVLAAVGALAFTAFRSPFVTVTQGPFAADGACPSFKARYSLVQITFGNRGLSTLNSLYETFVGEGAFEISEFNVASTGNGRFTIVGSSNRGPLTSDIFADRVVRLGQDREDEELRRTLQSAFCHRGRIYEHQLVDLGDGSTLSQDLEYWTENAAFRFRLYQNRRLTADVTAR
ncbi:hypothetical protein GCM10007973_24700 [Polymorphobacter multimanifer]|uniref:Uncharacterized protein n=1 Tax=Polymorphobacter multimanifer TaxID=1070431 RepID=A0A841L9F1_9SPHN|nr:hypothetical protein [Polymorphobacter multimanifer]MBB6226465.1 hypothetical protein [Polymorphobacter multimanifer]GGI87301.1 hypothetical protein GCM10007973_24700 [Polymorphobacter multimanifer]